MAGGNGSHLTANCSEQALKQCSSQMVCPVDANATFVKSMSIRGQLWQVNALLVVEPVLATVIVGIGAYGQRYRHHPITRFLFLGANTIFLPIISSIASIISLRHNFVVPFRYYDDDDMLSALVASCGEAVTHVAFFLILASLVLVVMINTSTIVSVDDREGPCRGPPLEVVIRGIWTFYLVVSLLKYEHDPFIEDYFFILTPYALLSSKVGLKYYSFEKARRSVALGRNPELVFVYMRQLQAQEAADQQHVGEPLAAPPLLVMGESEQKVEKHPQGYAFKDDCSGTTSNKSDIGLVTIDRIWQLDSKLPIATPRLKDLCLSFALFKLLRCRFARYKLTNSGSRGTLIFFQSLLLKAGEHDRVFEVITEELSFVHDYYYSSLPISYSNVFLPILGIFLSHLTIGYCIWQIALLTKMLIKVRPEAQLGCLIWCVKGYLVSNASYKQLGVSFFDQFPLLLVLVLVVTAEVRDMASYICSNWTKVTLICHYINRNSSAYSLCMQKLVGVLLRCRCKMMKHWDDKMRQCSLLVPHPKTTPIVLVNYCLLRVPDQRRKVKVPAAVKVSIINAVRRNVINNGRLSNGAESLRQSQVGQSFIWACHGKGTSDIILAWHIATCILELKHPDRHPPQQEHGSPLSPSADDHKITATHLSKYCAYLMIWCPELLPDNNAWSKGLYEEVKKDAERALTGLARSTTPEAEYQNLVDLLMSENSKHEVLENGVKLGKQLVETINDEKTAWKLLADFWSEMILYVAPSNKLKGHSEAIARGGELITVLWALLFHAGIVDRPGEVEDVAAATSAGAVY